MTTLHTHIYILTHPLWDESLKGTEQINALIQRLDDKIKEWPGIVKCIITPKKITVYFIGEVVEDSDVREWTNQVLRGAIRWPFAFPGLGRTEPVRQQHQASPRDLAGPELTGLRKDLLRDAQKFLAHTSRHISPDEATRRGLLLVTYVLETLV